MKKTTTLFLFSLAACFSYGQSATDGEYLLIGKVKPRNANEIGSSNWIIGCETFDRDFTNYDEYKEFLVPLGIKRLRMQTGWAKTEQVKGQYDFAWLDHIVNDATERDLQPWLQFSYGNPIYEGGGGINLAAGIPYSKEALQAWDNWVAAMVTRYKDRVQDWQVWNEPNFGNTVNMANGPEATAALNLRTVEIVKRIQPEARVSGLTMGHMDLVYADTFFKILNDAGKLKLFHDIVYHDYVYNPDSHYPEVMKLRAILDKYAPEIPLRQGENGAPSMGGPGRGAIGDHDWTELSQAKWDTRRMLGDLGHDIESSVFTIIDIPYSSGPIKRLNVKGLISSDSTQKAIRPKMAYHAVQHVATIFDHALTRIPDVDFTQSTPTRLAVYVYRDTASSRQLFTIWANGDTPNNSTDKEKVDFTFSQANFKKPVNVDIITGEVYQVPRKQWSKSGDTYTFRNVPVYDGPVLIAEQSLIPLEK